MWRHTKRQPVDIVEIKFLNHKKRGERRGQILSGIRKPPGW
jgi:hypothetical protein